MILVTSKRWIVSISKSSQSRHSYFCFSNFNCDKDKTFENNTLTQCAYFPVLFGYVVSITRTRLFSEVKNIQKFIDGYSNRIGRFTV